MGSEKEIQYINTILLGSLKFFKKLLGCGNKAIFFKLSLLDEDDEKFSTCITSKSQNSRSSMIVNKLGNKTR